MRLTSELVGSLSRSSADVPSMFVTMHLTQIDLAER